MLQKTHKITQISFLSFKKFWEILFYFLIFVTLLNAQEASDSSQTNEANQEIQTMTKAQELWGRKFQASLGYSYYLDGHHGFDIGYGMWDINKMGILASILFPINYTAQQSKLYLISFFWVWDWSPIKMLSIMPKIGYGAKIYHQRGLGERLSWEPTMGLDLSLNINSFIRIYTSYTWAMYENHAHDLKQLHGFSGGLRIAY